MGRKVLPRTIIKATISLRFGRFCNLSVRKGIMVLLNIPQRRPFNGCRALILLALTTWLIFLFLAAYCDFDTNIDDDDCPLCVFAQIPFIALCYFVMIVACFPCLGIILTRTEPFLERFFFSSVSSHAPPAFSFSA